MYEVAFLIVHVKSFINVYNFVDIFFYNYWTTRNEMGSFHLNYESGFNYLKKNHRLNTFSSSGIYFFYLYSNWIFLLTSDIFLFFVSKCGHFKSWKSLYDLRWCYVQSFSKCTFCNQYSEVVTWHNEWTWLGPWWHFILFQVNM